MIAAAEWNSLEAAKLGVSLLTPLVVLGLGLLVNRASRRLEQAQWANRQLIERRLNLYDMMAPLLNDLLCFFTLVGDYRSVQPPAAIAAKRTLDKTFHVNRFLFSPAFSAAYDSFMDVCFQTYTGVGEPAKLRSTIEFQRPERKDTWNEEWNDLFVFPARHASSLSDIRAAYESLMNCFAEELGVNAEGAHRGRRNDHLIARTSEVAATD